MNTDQHQPEAQKPPRIVVQDNVMNSMRSVMYGMQRGEEPIQWLAVVTMFKPLPEEELPERVQLQLFGALNIYDPDEIMVAAEAIRRAASVALRLSGVVCRSQTS